MNLRTIFLILTAATEVVTGIVLIFVPSIAFSLLLGIDSPAPEAIFIGRVTGSALIAIGVGAWWARTDERCAALVGVLVGILVYDVAAAILLAFAAIVIKMSGIGLWPGVALHSVLAVLCLKCLLALPRDTSTSHDH
jgi:hypothetical protein